MDSVQMQDTNGNWVPAIPMGLMCEVHRCNNPVTLDDQYERADKNLPNGWGDEPEILCKEHSVGRIKIAPQKIAEVGEQPTTAPCCSVEDSHIPEAGTSA